MRAALALSRLGGAALALLALQACAPRATVAEPDRTVLSFAELPSYDLEIAAPGRSLLRGEVSVVGVLLEIESPYCAVTGCVPDPDGYIRLTFPEEDEANYGGRIVIDVTGGIPVKGRALMVLEGEDASRPALLETLGGPL